MSLTHKILAVDDEPDILRLTQYLLESWGYEVASAENGREAIEVARQEIPDLILMDVNMEEMNGLEACEHLKSDFSTSFIPVIMLTSQDQVSDKITGLGKGADDYVIKTVDPLELKARIEMVIRRTQEQSSANPLTKLPGNIMIERVVQQRLAAGSEFSVCYCDLDNFKAYNDKYGYEAGDRVIVHTARLLIQSVREKGDPSDFVGHIGGDDFVIVTNQTREDGICSGMIKSFDETIPDFYDQQDKTRQHIEVENRSGSLERFPIMSITIAVVNNVTEKVRSSHAIAERAAELKKYLKRFQGSNYLSERRGAPEQPNQKPGPSGNVLEAAQRLGHGR
jgi:diguanylate cyclase (GGDEF)-like protein